MKGKRKSQKDKGMKKKIDGRSAGDIWKG